jgi:hypothetical protein
LIDTRDLPIATDVLLHEMTSVDVCSCSTSVMASRSTKFTFGDPWVHIAALCFVLLIVLAIVKWEHFGNPVPGAFYEIDGAKMHIKCITARTI